jgi:hypothetical protein
MDADFFDALYHHRAKCIVGGPSMVARDAGGGDNAVTKGIDPESALFPIGRDGVADELCQHGHGTPKLALDRSGEFEGVEWNRGVDGDGKRVREAIGRLKCFPALIIFGEFALYAFGE